MTTGELVLQAMQAYGVKKESRAGQYRSRSPFRSDSDSLSFTFYIEDDGEHGAWQDRPAGESGSLYQLAAHLGIAVETNRVPIASTKRQYTGLADYADAHGLTADELRAARWEEKTWEGRPALIFQTKSGARVRFLDNKDPKYKSCHTGHRSCWYGLQRAVKIAAEKALPLVICNGEVSTLKAQKHGIPACAQSGHGEKALDAHILAELRELWQGEIWIALDCDKAGRVNAQKIAAQLPGSVVLDLGFTESGDLCDFAMLHQDNAMAALSQIVADHKSRLAHLNHQEVAITVNQSRVVIRSSSELASVIFDQVEANLADPKDIRGYRSGLTDLDDMVKGFEVGQYTVIIAATNMGKSFFATSIARGLADQAPGMIIPTEMSPKDWSKRMIANLAGVSSEAMHTGFVTPDQRTALYKAMARFSEYNLMFMDLKRPTFDDIRRQIDAAYQVGARWVVLDGFQRLQTRNMRASSQYERTLELASELQILVQESGMTWIVTSQTGRSSKDRARAEPNLFDAKGGGEIEENADTMLGLYDDKYYVDRFGKSPDPEWIDGCVKVLLLKHRHRPMRRPFVWLRRTDYGFTDAPVRYLDVTTNRWHDHRGNLLDESEDDG